MTDIASLGFSIDTSNVQPASDSLDKLSDAAERVRASTRFLVQDFSSTSDAIQQLSTSGRASLASFVQIADNLDAITQRLNALRGAAADTIGTLGGNALSSALTTFQQNFAAMATLFGTSTAQLEAFNKQAEYLGLQSYQVAAAMQRITQAQQNMGPAGAAIRQALTQEGISTAQDPTAILRQVQEYYAAHQNSQLAANTLQELLGPIDPGTMAGLRYQPYRSVDQQRAEFLNNTLGFQASQTSSNAAQLSYQNQLNSQRYQDTSSYLGLTDRWFGGASEQNQFIKDLTRRLKTDTGGQASADQKLLDQLRAAQPGSQNAIGAEAQFDISNPTDPLAQRTMSYEGRARLAMQPISDLPSWYERFTDTDFKNANQNYIGAEYDARRANVGPGFLGIPGAIADFALNTDEISDTLANRAGLYTRTPTAAQNSAPIIRRGRAGATYFTDPNLSTFFGAPPIVDWDAAGSQGANESYDQRMADAGALGQLGYMGFGAALNAGTAIGNLKETAPNSISDRFRRYFGSAEGSALVAQMIGQQQYIQKNAATPGFQQLDPLRQQGWLAGQATGTDEAAALASYAQSVGIDTSQWTTGGAGGGPLSMGQILAGQGPAGAALTAGQQSTFRSIWGQSLKNATAAQNSQFTQRDQLADKTQALAESASGPGDYSIQLSGLQAYSDVIKSMGDKATKLAALAQTQAITEAIKAQNTEATLATKALTTLNNEQAKAISAGNAALLSGQPGAFSASQFQSDIQAQIDQYKNGDGKHASPADQAKQIAQIKIKAQNGVVSDVQGSLGQYQDQLGMAQATLSTVGQGTDARNRAQISAQFQSQLTETASDPQAHQQIENLINSLVAVKDSLDNTNLALTDLQTGLAAYRTAEIYQEAAKLPPDQRATYIASAQSANQIISQANFGLSGGVQNNPTNLHFAGQPGATGADSRGNANFDNMPDSLAATENQLRLDQTKHGDRTLSQIITRWNPPNAPGNTQQSTDREIAQVAHVLGVDPNAPYSVSVGSNSKNFAQALAKSESGGSFGSGLGSNAAAGTFAATVAQEGLQGQNAIDLSSARSAFVNANVLPLLRLGQTGAASIADAHFVDPNTPSALQGYTQAAQLSQARDSLDRAVASLQGETQQRIANDQTLANASMQGPGATLSARAQIASDQSALQNNKQDNPAWIAKQTADYLKEFQLENNIQAGNSNFQRQQEVTLQTATLQNSLIANPYQRILADAQTKQGQQDKIDYGNGVSQSIIASNDALSQQAASLDVIAAKQQEVAQGMGQIGSAVGSTLQNVAFSYQHGPGAGLYARQQISGLLNTGARSLFQTVVGNPIENAVTGNLSDLVDTLMGNTPGSGPTGSGGGSRGGGTSGASQTLGGLSGAASNMVLSHALQGLGSWLFGGGGMTAASMAAHTGASAADPALAAAPSLFSRFLSFFATGGAFSGGQRMPFALGGTFGPGMRTPFASGDMFDSPTTMPMALLGEAGPEAIMPLRRGADGRLGVAAGGGGGGGASIVVNAPITVGQGALQNNGQMSHRQQQDLQRQLHQTVTRAVQGVMADQSRPGGMIQPQQR